MLPNMPIPKKKYSLFLRTGFWITTVLSLFCGVVLMIGSAYFSQTILKDVQYKSVFIIFGATIILYAFNTMLVAVINGFREFKKYVTVNIAGSLVGLLFSVILAYGFGIYGALIAAITYQSVVFIITFILVVRSHWFKSRIFIGKFSKLAAVKLWQYSLMALITAVVVPVSQLLVRGYINERTSSMTAAGLWEGMNRISSMYLMVITTSLSIYYLPKLAQLKTKNEIRNEIFHVYKLIVPFLLILSLCIFISRHIIIHVLFNNKFAGMENLFAFQLAGDFFKTLSGSTG